MRSQVPH